MPVKVTERFSSLNGTAAPSTKCGAFDEPPHENTFPENTHNRNKGPCEDRNCLCYVGIPAFERNLFPSKKICPHMAEIQVDPNVTDHQQLVFQGTRAYNVRSYDTAVQALSKAIALKVEAFGDEQHDSLGPIYVYYGKSLLELTRSEMDPVGEGVPQTIPKGDKSDSDDDEEEMDAESEANQEDEKKEEEGEGSGEKPSTSAESMETSGSAEGTADAAVAGPSNNGAGPSTSQGAPEDAEEEEEEPSDLQVAWEVLELAKKILLRRSNEGELKAEGENYRMGICYLADTWITLGEISLENEKYDDAVNDIKEGLKIQQALFPEENRAIAETYYKLGVVFGTNSQLDEAMNCFEEAQNILRRKLAKLQALEEKTIDDEMEIDDLKELVPTIEEKINEVKSYKDEVTSTVDAFLKCSKSEVVDTNGSSHRTDEEPEKEKPQPKVNDISHLVKRKRPSEANDKQEKKDPDDYKPVEKKVC